MEIKWIKLDVGLFDNPKIKHVRRLPDGDKMVLFWVMLLTIGGRCNQNGKILLAESVPYSAAMLAAEFSLPEDTVEKALALFEQLGMIGTRGGILTIKDWEEHQSADKLAEIRERNRLRKQKQRQLSRDSHGTVTGCHAIEEEKEREKEEEEEEEFHSINHSAEDPIRKQMREYERRQAIVKKYLEWHDESKRMEISHGGMLFMSEEQMSDLLDKLSLDEFDKYIGIIIDCESKGKHFKKKSHYDAILDMVSKDRRIRT